MTKLRRRHATWFIVVMILALPAISHRAGHRNGLRLGHRQHERHPAWRHGDRQER